MAENLTKLNIRTRIATFTTSINEQEAEGRFPSKISIVGVERTKEFWKNTELRKAEEYLIRLHANGCTLECTQDTLIGVYTTSSQTFEWLRAADIEVGMMASMYDGDYTINSVEVLAVCSYGKMFSVVGINKDITYYANNFAVKNNIVEIEEENREHEKDE